MMRCRGADSRARRNAADPNRLSPKRHRPPELSLRGRFAPVAISGRHCRLVPAAVKTEPVPTGLVAALTAQPLAALPPYGCGVPLAGSERCTGLFNRVRTLVCTALMCHCEEARPGRARPCPCNDLLQNTKNPPAHAGGLAVLSYREPSRATNSVSRTNTAATHFVRRESFASSVPALPLPR